MRIGVDATSWPNARGYGRFTREVLRAMLALPEAGADEFVLFVERSGAPALEGLLRDGVRVRPVDLSEAPTRAAAAGGHRSAIDMLRLTRAVRAERPDVFFSPTVYTYFPLPPGLRACVCVHDAIAERFPKLTVPDFKSRLFWNLKVWLALRQARIVLTVSEYSRRDLVRVLKVPESRLRVAVEAPAAAFRPSDDPADVAAAAARVGVRGDARWLVYVGGFNPHKNVDLLVRAHAAVSHDHPDLHLLLVGGVSEDVFHGAGARIRAAIDDCGTGHLVRWCGYVPDEELRHLYTGALAAVLPSECEGFGLPAVEAAACGAAVVATTESPLPELLEGGGIFVRPGDTAALEAALARFASDGTEREAMARAALERASALSWPRAATAALDAVHEAARRPRGAS
jgi:alpha-1,3-rhamnosyl/mannosyltransferase